MERGSAKRLAWKADQPDERRHAVDRPKSPERTRGRFAEGRVPVGRNVDQRGDRGLRVKAAERDDGLLASNAAKVRAIADAQRDGLLSTRFEPAVLLGLILTISGTWSSMTPEYTRLVRRLSVAKRRQAIVDAVAALLA